MKFSNWLIDEIKADIELQKETIKLDDELIMFSSDIKNEISIFTGNNTVISCVLDTGITPIGIFNIYGLEWDLLLESYLKDKFVNEVIY